MGKNISIENSKCFILLNTFKAKAIIKFDKFLRSPFHNENPKLVKLYQLLRPALEDDTIPILDKTQIAQKIFNDPNNTKALNSALNKIKTLAEHFLIIFDLQKESIKMDYLKVQMLWRQNHSDFIKEAEKLIKNTKAKKLLSYEDYHIIIQLNHQIWEHIQIQRYNPKRNYIQDILEHQEEQFIIRRLIYLAEIKNRRSILNKDIDIKAPLITIDLSILSEKTNNPNITLLTLLNQLIDDPENIKLYWTLKQKLINNHKLITKERASDILIYLANYANRRWKTGKIEFAYQLLDNYKLGYKWKVFMQNNLVSEVVFTNIALISLKMNQLIWFDNFIQDNKKYLPVTSKNYVLSYISAYKHFHLKAFSEVLHILGNINYNFNISYHIHMRGLQLRTYYEIKYPINNIKIELKSFASFLKRNQTASNRTKKEYNNFCILLMNLITIRTKKPFSKNDLINLIERRQNLSTSEYRDFLLKKLNDQYLLLKNKIINITPLQLLYREWLLEKLKEHYKDLTYKINQPSNFEAKKWIESKISKLYPN